MDEISRNGSVLLRLRSVSAEKTRLVSQLEFDVNLVEREGRRLEADLSTVQSLVIQDGDEETDGTETETKAELAVLTDGKDSRVKCVRFTESQTSEELGPSLRGSGGSGSLRNQKPKSILKVETSDGDCSSDTGLSSLSVSSEEGTYSLTTLV